MRRNRFPQLPPGGTTATTKKNFADGAVKVSSSVYGTTANVPAPEKGQKSWLIPLQ